MTLLGNVVVSDLLLFSPSYFSSVSGLNRWEKPLAQNFPALSNQFILFPDVKQKEARMPSKTARYKRFDI